MLLYDLPDDDLVEVEIFMRTMSD